MLRFLFIPRSVLGFGLRIGLLFALTIGLGRLFSIALTQVVETGYVLMLLLNVQGFYFSAILQAILAASPLGTT